MNAITALTGAKGFRDSGRFRLLRWIVVNQAVTMRNLRVCITACDGAADPAELRLGR